MFKKILVLAKRTAFDYYFGKLSRDKFIAQGQIGKQQIQRFEKTHAVHYQSLSAVEKSLKRLGFTYDLFYRGTMPDYRRYDLIITVGGDGTFIEASHHLKSQYILGINSDPFWSVGRFCAINASQLFQLLSSKLKYRVVNLARLEVSVNDKILQPLVINEVLFCHKNPAGLSRYYLKIADRYEEQRSSGLWVATPAGSTGAIRSAGAKEVSLRSQIIQYKPRELYVALNKTYGLKGGVLKHLKDFELISLIREGVMYIDGSHVSYSMGFGSVLKINQAEFPLRMLVKR